MLKSVANVGDFKDEIEDRIENKMGRWEKKIIKAVDMVTNASLPEKVPAHHALIQAPPMPMDYGWYPCRPYPPPLPYYPEEMAQVNAAGNWNHHGQKWDPHGSHYNPGWRAHPNFRWTDPNAQPPAPQSPPYQAPPPPTQALQPPQYQSQSPSYHQPNHQQPFHHHQNNQHPHQNNPNQPPPYRPPIQRNNYSQSYHPSPYPSQPSSSQTQQPKPPKTLGEMIGDLVHSQQSCQDTVKKVQDAQKELKVVFDQLSCQMSQLATSMCEIRGNDGTIPSQVQKPHRANVSQVTLRSERELKGPRVSGMNRGKVVGAEILGSSPYQNEHWENDMEQQVMEEALPSPKGSDPLNQF